MKYSWTGKKTIRKGTNGIHDKLLDCHEEEAEIFCLTLDGEWVAYFKTKEDLLFYINQKTSKFNALQYYNMGKELANVIRNLNYKAKSLTAKTIAEASGYPERSITLALKIFKHFENKPEDLNGLTTSKALKLIKK